MQRTPHAGASAPRPTPSTDATIRLVLKPLGDDRYRVSTRFTDTHTGDSKTVSTLGIGASATLAHQMLRLGYAPALFRSFADSPDPVESEIA